MPTTRRRSNSSSGIPAPDARTGRTPPPPEKPPPPIPTPPLLPKQPNTQTPTPSPPPLPPPPPRNPPPPHPPPSWLRQGTDCQRGRHCLPHHPQPAQPGPRIGGRVLRSRCRLGPCGAGRSGAVHRAGSGGAQLSRCRPHSGGGPRIGRRRDPPRVWLFVGKPGLRRGLRS